LLDQLQVRITQQFFIVAFSTELLAPAWQRFTLFLKMLVGNSMRAAILASGVLVMGLSLSGCAVYEVASTAVDVTTTVVGATVDVVGDIVTAPFPSSDSDKKSKTIKNYPSFA
jgi:hypothetical protein